MADVPYADWFAYALRFFPKGKDYRIAELCSGPGRMAGLARAAGFYTVCLDFSLATLSATEGERVCGDVRRLPFTDGAFGALLAVNGSVNYLPDTDALERYFSECRRVLSAAGSLIMDFCPLSRAAELHGRSFQALDGKVNFAHRFNAQDAELVSLVTIKSDGQTSLHELHRQRIFSWRQIKAAAEAAGFDTGARDENFNMPYAGLSPMVSCVFVRRT